MKLQNKVAVVTGAGKGIGEATAIALNTEGAHVVVSDIDIKLAKKTSDKINFKGGNSIAVKADVSSKSEVKNLFDKTIEHFGRIDILSSPLILFEVANALRYHPLVRLSIEELVTATEALRDMAIIVEMSKEMWTKTFEISRTEGITTYDATYLSLALSSDAMFVTADSKLLNGLSENLKQYTILLHTMK